MHANSGGQTRKGISPIVRVAFLVEVDAFDFVAPGVEGHVLGIQFCHKRAERRRIGCALALTLGRAALTKALLDSRDSCRTDTIGAAAGNRCCRPGEASTAQCAGSCNIYGSPRTGGGGAHLGHHSEGRTWGRRRLCDARGAPHLGTAAGW